MINRVKGVAGAAAQPQRTTQSAPSQVSFGAMLQQAQQDRAQQAQPQQPERTQEPSAINFSKHAMSRAEERGIELTPALMEQLAGSVEKAQEKGAKNILAFNATQAFIINVPYGRVITTLSQDEMKENIFTNIDGAVLI